MLKRRRFFWLLGALSLLVGAGCGSGDSSSNGPLTSTPTRSAGLVLTTSTSHQRYAKGAAIPVTLTVTNTGAQSAQLTFGGCFDYNISFQQAGAQVWYGPNLLCGGDLRPVTIAAGATQTYTISWSATDPLNDPLEFDGVLPKPGTYNIVATFMPLTLNGAQLSDAQRAALVTSPITVIVNP